MLTTTDCCTVKHKKETCNRLTYMVDLSRNIKWAVCSDLWMWGKQLSLIKYLELYSKLCAKQLFGVFTKIFCLWIEHYCAVLCFKVNYYLHISPLSLNWMTQGLPLGCSLPTVLWVSMLSCLTYFTNHPQTTLHISHRSSTHMLSTGSPQGCVLLNSWESTTLQSAALFLSVNTTVMQKVQQQLYFHILKMNRGEKRLLMSFYFITI